MPIWLRKFTFKQIQEHYESQNKQSTNPKGNSTNDLNKAKDIIQKAQSSDPRVSKPNFNSNPKVNIPDFVTSKGGASKK